MKRGEVIGMSIFGLLVAGALGLAVRQGAQQRAQVASYSSRHGWSVSRAGDARLSALLAETAPEMDWRPNNVMPVERAPEALYFFGYQVSPQNRSSKSSTGHACLAEHSGRAQRGPVEIFNRTPGVDKFLLEHASGPGWYLTVRVAGRSVLVSSSWAETEQDWDYLIALARKLRTAVR
jgi:hypothetical protein